MNLYNGEINEFVNWSTGQNELTENQVTQEGQKISGLSIRNLLGDHLKKPFVTYEDTRENKIYFFSSNEAKTQWEQHRDEDNNKKYTDLVLYSMTKPSDYTIELDDAFLEKEHRYITAGSSGLLGSIFLTNWKVKLGNNSKSETLEISYEITSGKGKKTTSVTHSTSGAGNVGNIYIDTTDYLEEGINTVTLNIWGVNTGVTMTVVQYVHVVVFSIDSSFEYYKGIDANKDNFKIPIDLTRNEKKLVASIYVYIDGELAFLLTAPVNSSNDHYDITIQNPIVQLSTGTRKYRSCYKDPTTGDVVNVEHILLIWATTTISGVEFKTNLLYYTFVVKSAELLENHIIPVHTSFSNSIHNGYISDLRLYGTQYMPINIDWAYYTDIIGYDSNISVAWKISCIKDDVESLRDIEINEGKLNGDPKTLTFIPIEYNNSSVTDEPELDKLDEIYLCAYGTVSTISGYESVKILSIPMTVEKSSISISEPSGYDIELTAYNKNNQSSDKDQWSTTGTIHNVNLHGVLFNSNSGWYDHSLRLSGVDSYAEFTYNAFDETSSSINSRGLSIEFEFESEKVNSTDDVILTIGSTYVNQEIEGSTKPVRIEVTPNSAILYNNDDQPIIKTNFKQNERVKLCFIINRTNISTYDRSKVYIVSNGILERASLWAGSLGYDESNLADIAKGKITIGKSPSGIKFYSMRIWSHSIPYTTAYNNYVYDNENKNKIFLNNDVLVDGSEDVSFLKCLERLNTVLIKETDDVQNSHFLDTIFLPGAEKDESLTNGTLELYSRDDDIDNVTVENCLFRKHGQSTLKYPIPSLKIWFGKKYNASKNDIPLFTCAAQAGLGLNKNRYKMRPDSIPANKYILQANYADSSGTHNGSILRLILNCWYNANIDGYFRLRSLPQLFASIDVSEKNKYPEATYNNKVWADYFSTPFPYEIRNAADSFPCVVFYETRDGNKNYLGQYVFMDDKKSDFTYGERSIYKAAADDPFCLKTTNKDKDTDSNLIWDNNNVLRIEVLEVNDLFTSYMTFEKDDVLFDDVINDEGTLKFKWEQNFELIYPDPDDVETEKINNVSTFTKFNTNSKFRRVTKPFVDWVKWLTDTRNNYNVSTQWWDAGLYSSAQEAFNATAEDHLDLWKMAAYYVFMLRFALTDSGERNVQIKTYDGVHFHYEPWDMDIALGNKNDGGIAFTPPVDRTTQLDDGSYAISGKSAGTSNWLWDALEGYTYWVDTMVPKVADALYNAGLTYENCIEMFDDQYADKWNETIYNKSGYFKYIESGGDQQQYLNWLQGARKPHRHWWLNTSMNYYDAKWGCGTFKNKSITFYAGHVAGVNEENIIIRSSTPTYVSMEINQGATKLGTLRIDSHTPALYNIGSQAMNYKVPSDIYGAVNIEHLDFSCVGGTFNRIQLENSYDAEAGAKLKTLNIGVQLTDTENPNIKTGPCNVANDGGITGGDALQALEVLNVRGQRGGKNPNTYVTFTLLRDELYEQRDLVNVKEFYGMGANINLFYSSYRGNNFDILELPSSITELDLRNSSWNTIEFWDAEIGTISNIPEDAEDNPEITYLPPGTAIYTKHSTNGDTTLNIPATLNTVRFNGTTGNSEKSKEFVLGWINSIIASLGENPTQEQIDTILASKKLYMDSVNWTSGDGRTLLTFEELSLIAKMQHHLSGYILLASDPNNPLQSEDLNNIISWFGNDVFSKSSGGIIIDYNLNRTIISVGGPTEYFYIDDNNKPCVKEGGYCTLNATKFLLRADSTEYVWKLRAPNSNDAGRDYYRECKLNTSGRTVLLEAKESAFDEDYEVEAFTVVDGSIVSIKIKVIVSSYPTLALNRTANSTAKESGNSLSLDEYGSYVDLFVTSSGESTVNIQSILYSIYNHQTNQETDLGFSSNLPSEYIILDDKIKYKKCTIVDDAISILSLILSGDNNIYKYTVKCKVNFKAKSIIAQKDFYVINDSLYILDTSNGSALSLAIHNAYTALYGENSIRYFYRTDLLNITGTLNLNADHTINDLLTEKGDSIFKYLFGVSTINLDSCYHLTRIKDGVNQLDFSNMSELLYLSIRNCSALTGDIDLTDNINITNVNAEGTTVNVFVPDNTIINGYILGKPTNIRLINPINLTSNNIKVDEFKNITDIEIIKANDQDANSYSLFKNIMQKYDARSNIRYGYASKYRSNYNDFSTSDWLTPENLSSSDPILINECFISNAIDIHNYVYHTNLVIETDMPIETDKAYGTGWKLYNSSGSVVKEADNRDPNNNYGHTIKIANANTNAYYLIIYGNISKASYITVKTYNDNTVLFEWKKVSPSMTNLKLLLGTGSQEVVLSRIINILYSIAMLNTPELGEEDPIVLSGNLLTTNANSSQVNYLVSRFTDLHITNNITY